MSKFVRKGIYADLIGQYIDYKRSLGFKMHYQECLLNHFDTFTAERKEHAIGISKELSDEWSKSRNGESSTTRYLRICALKGFSVYLQILGYESYVPKLPKFNFTYIPHVYSQEDMAAIFKGCDKLIRRVKTPRSSIWVMPTIIRMLYGTGIRISEALKLKHGDVDLASGVLWLRECKNGQDRLVPMSNSLVEVCKDYIAFKEKIGLQVENQNLFYTAMNGSPCTVKQIEKYFHIVLFREGINNAGCLHSLRHTMASNALVKMSSAGMDLYYSLPILMTYLGHQSLRATNHYVRTTHEMYPELIRKNDEICKYVFPDIIYETENDEEL